MKIQEKEHLQKYMQLLYDFIENRITISEFEINYLKIFKNDGYQYSKVNYEALAILFGDVDAYCSNAELRDNEDIDEKQLYESAIKTLRLLSAGAGS